MKKDLFITTEITSAVCNYLYQRRGTKVHLCDIYPVVEGHISEVMPDFDVKSEDSSGELILKHYTRWGLNSLKDNDLAFNPVRGYWTITGKCCDNIRHFGSYKAYVDYKKEQREREKCVKEAAFIHGLLMGRA